VKLGNQQAQSKAETLDKAINHLVIGLKQDLQKKHGQVDYEKLREQGFSDYLLYRLEKARS
jgi:hypothetical protein